MKNFLRGSSWERLQWAVYPLLFAFFAVVFYWKVLFTSGSMFPWDCSDFFYPYLNFVHEELRHFRLPLWNPFVMSGYPMIGDMESQTFYPINWLFLVLSFFSPLSFRLVEIQLIFHFFLGGYFMFLLARDMTGKTIPSLMAGLLFMSSGSMVAHTQHLAIINSMAWYPLIFLTARRALLRGSLSWSIVSGLLYGVQLLAGHWQHSMYMGLILFFYYVWHALFGPERKKIWPRWMLQLLLISGIGIGLALVQILPSVELGFQSVRNRLTYWDMVSGNPPSYLWTLFLPNYFGGINGAPLKAGYDLSLVYVFITVPGFLLAILGLAETIRKRNFFYVATLAFLILFSFGLHGPFGDVLFAIPGLNRFRNPGMLFDPAYFLLCLMVALGAKVLFSQDVFGWLRRHVLLIAVLLLISTVSAGLVWNMSAIPGWYEMVVVLGLSLLAVTGFLRNWIGRGPAIGAICVLLLFQVIHNNMNQKFNRARQNPDSYATPELALGSSGVLEFLRSAPDQDFRTWASAEYILSTNGWNIWRIPSISGWNPITLEAYQEYIQEFVQCQDYTSAKLGGDHELGSPLLDLLGVRYLISINGGVNESLIKSGDVQHVFTDSDWWHIYENKDYVSRALFFPRAYTVSGKEQVLPVMKSSWFDARQTLVLDKADLPDQAKHLAKELTVIQISPEQVHASSGGQVTADAACAQPQLYFRDWNGEGSWVQFRVSGLEQPGRYALLLRYASSDAEMAASVEVAVENRGRRQSSSAVVLPRTAGWNCASQRTAELGLFDLVSGDNILTLTLRRKIPVDLYSIVLVRLPEVANARQEPLTITNASYGVDHVSLTAEVPEEGFLLLNDIFYPGWEATIDGKPAPIFRVNAIFRGVQVSEGTHRVELVFRPNYLLIGGGGSLATLFLAVFFLQATCRKERRLEGAACAFLR